MVPDAIDLSSIRRALVIKLRHHGDVLLTSPVFQALKNHAPHLEVDALVYGDTKEMLTLHPAIVQVHAVDRDWKRLGIVEQVQREWALLQVLKARRFELVIHLTEHPRGAWLARLLGAKYRVVRDYDNRSILWKSSFTHRYPVPGNGARHTVELHLDALRRIGLYPEEAERALVLEPGETARARAKELMSANGLQSGKFVHFHPTSRWLFKSWTNDKAAALIDRLAERGEQVVLTSGPNPKERAVIADIRSRSNASVVDLSGTLSLKELAALCAQAKLFIGVDSAPMHIACAMGTPVVVLFGPSGDKEWGPWRVPHRVVTSSSHPCRPCGNDGCGGGKISECLTTLPVEHVLAAVDDVMARGGGI